MGDRQPLPSAVCPSCRFTDSIPLETTTITESASWQCLECGHVWRQSPQRAMQQVQQTPRGVAPLHDPLPLGSGLFRGGRRARTRATRLA